MFAALLSVATCAVADKAPGAQARWEDVIKAAEKEGEVTVYATNSVGDLQVIWDAFKKKFPKIKLNSVGISTTSEIVTKVMAERRANQYLVDVMLGAPGATYNSFYRGKALEPMPPALVLPEVTDLSKWWKGKHRYGLSGSVVMFIDNVYGRVKLKTLLPLNKKSAILTALNTTEEQFLAAWKKHMLE